MRLCDGRVVQPDESRAIDDVLGEQVVLLVREVLSSARRQASDFEVVHSRPFVEVSTSDSDILTPIFFPYQYLATLYQKVLAQ